jgi:hypothetical protein
MTQLSTVISAAQDAQLVALKYGYVEGANGIAEYISELLIPDHRPAALPPLTIEQWTWAACLVGVVACLA